MFVISLSACIMQLIRTPRKGVDPPIANAVPRQNSIILCFVRYLAHYELRFQPALNR